MQNGRLISIHIASKIGKPTKSIPEVTLDAQKGLRGYRYYGNDPGNGKAVTLIENEALEYLLDEHGIQLDPGESRRNLVTGGVSLNSLVGLEFRVGEVILKGVDLCEPCKHLENLTRPGVLSGLIRRGGLRADVIRGGTIRVGDEIELLSKNSIF